MKKWYESKTLIINILGGVVVLLQYIGTINIVDPELLAAALVVVNFALRFVTSTSVERSIK